MAPPRSRMSQTQELIARVMRIVRACPEAANEVLELMFLVSQIKPTKRAGGRRYYRPEDVDLIRGVSCLLRGKGYTIRGAQRVLKENGVRFVQALGRGEAEVGAPTGIDRDEDSVEAAASDRRALEGALAELRACRALLAGLDEADHEAA